MKIEEIKKLKSGKYKIKVDGQIITTYDDVILDNHLLYQKEITEEELNKINIDSLHSQMYHKALNYALRKVRSVYEMRKYLEKLDIKKENIENIIERLKRMGVVSDASYVKAYVSDCLYLSNDGPDKIKQFLIDQGIEETLVLLELDKIDNSFIKDKLNKLIMKKIKNDKNHSSYQLRQKIVVDMVNLGYSRDMILDILSNVEFSDNDKLEKEYDKLYHKLEKKYEGKELFRKVQEKLYSKGFDIHDIQILIDKKKSEIF